ncbi:MAG: chorismate mutase [Alicyclobacillus sp.]|nr:chorismate mutase [Alicyclobacillus sp.]
MKVRGIRGAVTAADNTPEAIFEAAKTLMERLVAENDLDIDDVASVILTMSPDLNADFPAKAVRSLPGWQWVPLMCATELNVPHGLNRCIRMLVHVNTEKSQRELVHVYLGDAIQLRPDIGKG